MTQENKELLNCPIPSCGCKAILKEENDHHGDFYELGCSNEKCALNWLYYTQDPEEISVDEAVKVWNSIPRNHTPTPDNAKLVEEIIPKRNAIIIDYINDAPYISIECKDLLLEPFLKEQARLHIVGRMDLNNGTPALTHTPKVEDKSEAKRSLAWLNTDVGDFDNDALVKKVIQNIKPHLKSVMFDNGQYIIISENLIEKVAQSAIAAMNNASVGNICKHNSNIMLNMNGGLDTCTKCGAKVRVPFTAQITQTGEK